MLKPRADLAIFLAALLFPACEEARAPTREPKEARVELNDVQLECRSEKMLDIGQMNLSFGPTCDRPTMTAALDTFDMGSLTGFDQAEDEAFAMTAMCACKNIKCSDKTVGSVLDNTRRVFVDESGKIEREGVLRETNALANHSCLDATVGVMLFKGGFACGHQVALRSATVRKKMEGDYRKMVTGDEDLAMQQADACFASLTGPVQEQ